MDGMEREGRPQGDIVLMADPRVLAVPIADSDEGFIDVRALDVLVSDLRADQVGAFALLRRGVAERLARAVATLPAGVRLLFVEGYRPPALQHRYFERYLARQRESNPDADEQHVRMLASRHVSPPEVAPHCAGAAIDVTLARQDGTELDMGCPVNATPEQSAGTCFTDSPGISAQARHHRTVLADALAGEGFVNYPTEWWHWSFGDRYWALATDAPAALYGTRDPG